MYGISVSATTGQLGGVFDYILWSMGGAWADEDWNVTIDSQETRDALNHLKEIQDLTGKGKKDYKAIKEAFSKMDKERSEVCLHYARELELQLIVCVPDERLQSLIRNVDCVYGFRRHQNQVSMMHIDKGDYLDMVEGNE